jgi:hypothetical protein
MLCRRLGSVWNLALYCLLLSHIHITHTCWATETPARSAADPRRAPSRGGFTAARRLAAGDRMDAGLLGSFDSFQVALHHCEGWITTSTA